MADTNIYGEIPLELQPQMQDISQQQKLSQLLLQQGMQQPQGQMVSGHYVKPALTQYLQPLFAAYAGSKGMETAEQKQLDLAKAIRQIGGEETQKILELAKTDPNAAMAIAANAQTPQGKAFAPALMANLIPKTPDEVAKYKFAQTPEGGSFKGSYNDFVNQMTPYQKQSLALQAAAQNKPQIVETANGFVAVNPMNPSQAVPVMANGQPVTGSKGALTGTAATQVSGATNLKDAITEYQSKLKNFSTLDMANPNARAQMSNAYNNMMLQAKEAYNLGVLNGPDYKILTSVVADPTAASSLLISKNTLNQQATDLAKTADKIIKNVYETHQKPLPANLQTPAATKTPQFDPALLQYMTPEQRKLFGG